MAPSCAMRRIRDAMAVNQAYDEGDTASYLRRKLLIFSEDVSIIGARYVFDFDKTLLQRLIWFVLVLFSNVLAIYQIQDRLSFYLKYPTSAGASIMQNASLRFPQITFCNQNLYSRKTAQKYGNPK